MTLTETRKADRAIMAAVVAGQATTHGLEAAVVHGKPGSREMSVDIAGPHTLGLTVCFRGNTPQSEPDTYVLSWHMKPWEPEGKGWLLKPSAFESVNPHTGTKATDVASGWEELGQLLTQRFRDIATGAAFTHRYPVGQVIEYMSFARKTGYSVGQVMGLAPPQDQTGTPSASALYMIRNRSGGQPFPMREHQLREHNPS